MRMGKMTEAKVAAQQMTENPMWMRAVLQPCLNKAPETEVHRAAQVAEKELLPQFNSALKYYEGAVLAACGEKQAAFDFLHKAVEDKYCAPEALRDDPLFASVREDAEFKEIERAAAECHQKFHLAEGTGK